MDSYSAKLQALKTILVEETSFNMIMKYFLDTFGSDKNFIKYCKHDKYPPLKKIFRQISGELFGELGDVTHVILFRSKKDKFIHGQCFMNGYSAAVIYFEDIDMGLVAVCVSLSTGRTHYARFSITKIEGADPASFALNPPRTVQ